MTDLDSSNNILAAFHHHHSKRLDLIYARIRGIERAGDLVEANLAFDAALKVASQFNDIHKRCVGLRNRSSRQHLHQTQKPTFISQGCIVLATSTETLSEAAAFWHLVSSQR